MPDEIETKPEPTSVPENPDNKPAEETRSTIDDLAEFLPELAVLKKDKPAAAAPEKKDEPAKPEEKPEEKPLDRDKMQERIDELTRKNTDLSRDLEEARKKPEAKPAEAPAAPTPGILDTVYSATEVQGKVDLAHRVLGLTKRYFRDGEPVYVEDEKAEGGKRELTKEQLTAMEAEAEEIIRTAPDRVKFLEARESRTAGDREILPEFFEGEGAKKVARMSQAFPELMRFEDGNAATIALIIGFEEIARRKDAKGKAKPAEPAKAETPAPAKAEAKPPGGKVPLAPPAPGPSATPRVDAVEAKKGEARKALLESNGSAADLEAFFNAD